MYKQTGKYNKTNKNAKYKKSIAYILNPKQYLKIMAQLQNKNGYLFWKLEKKPYNACFQNDTFL